MPTVIVNAISVQVQCSHDEISDRDALGQAKITLEFLQHIQWKDSNGKEQELRLYDELSYKWEDVADLIGLSFSEQNEIRITNNSSPRGCFKNVVDMWLRNEQKLSKRYSCDWNGICKLLEAIKNHTASRMLKEALAADDSSFHKECSASKVTYSNKKKELKSLDSQQAGRQRIINTNDEVEGTSVDEVENPPAETCNSRRQHKCRLCSCIIVSVTILVILLVFFIIHLTIFSIVSIFQKKQCMVLRRNNENVVTLDGVVRNQWVSAVTMSWNDSMLDCSGDIWIVPGLSCLDSNFLNLTLGEDPYSDTNPYYALPDSFVSVTISGEDSAMNLVLRITKSIDSYVQFDDKYDDKRRSLEPCDEPLCYYTNKHINETIVFNITEPDFYYVFLTNSDGELVDERYVSLRFYYNIVSFNLTAIVEYATNHSIKSVQVDTNSPQIVKVSESFKFRQPTCNFLFYYCGHSDKYPGHSDKYPVFVIEGAKARSDVIILIVSVFFSIMFTFIVLFIKVY